MVVRLRKKLWKQSNAMATLQGNGPIGNIKAIMLSAFSLELQGGDWEAWISRFPRIFRSLPKLKRISIAQAAQCGLGGYDKLIYACLYCPELEYLDCSCNEEDMGQGPAVAALILRHPSLKTVFMGANELGADAQAHVVRAIKEAADSMKLVLEDLDGIELHFDRWREMLGLPNDDLRFRTMRNRDILSYLRENQGGHLLK